MYNERFGLEQAVIYGIKRTTRRTAYNGEISKPNWVICLEGKDKGKAYLCDGECVIAKSRYAIGEVVAIAQSYKSLGYDIAALGNHAGWNNKLYVCADFMPHRIKITDIRIERLQDISDEDCMKEGVYCMKEGVYYHTEPPKHHECDRYSLWNPSVKPYKFESNKYFCSAKYAFKHLIDRVSGKGTWECNPWVFVYDFELVK